MFNVGGPEVLVILLVALIVLGPQQLPKAVRSVGNVMAELRRMSSGFQEEIRSALDMPTETDARREGSKLAQRPEDADITETVAWNRDDEPDYHANGAGPETVPADDQPAAYDATTVNDSTPPARTGDADYSVAPSDRASG
jgi:sec-independent protein translocase protein TatB